LRPACIRRTLYAIPLRFGALHRPAVVPLAALLLVLCATAASRPATAAPSPIEARTAGTLALSETGRLRLTSHHGLTLNERGFTAGTISGTIYIHLNVVSTNRVTAEVSIYPSGGSLTGYATASYRPAGAVATFAGTMSVQRGSGRYGGAHGSGLSFSGTIQRVNDAVTVHVAGRMST
jgi:hypothetical protein